MFISSSLQFINLSALFSTVCRFLFWCCDAAHIGIGGYSRMGINSVFTKVVLILVDRFLKRLVC